MAKKANKTVTVEQIGDWGWRIGFLVGGGLRVVRSGGSHPQGRTWLLIGVIFAVVSVWLFQQG